MRALVFAFVVVLVGCGPDKLSGSVGVDRIRLPGVDVVCDLNQYPWPFEENHFGHVVCRHTISHLDDFVRACSPREAIVTAEFSARGGIALTVRAEYPDAR